MISFFPPFSQIKTRFQHKAETGIQKRTVTPFLKLASSVADPNPDLLDPYVLGLLYPYPVVRGIDPGPVRIRILLSPSKIWFLLLCDFFCDFLSLKNDVNVPSKSNKKKSFFEKISFLLTSWRSMTETAGSWAWSGSICQRHGSEPKCHGSATLEGSFVHCAVPLLVPGTPYAPWLEVVSFLYWITFSILHFGTLVPMVIAAELRLI